MDWKKLGRVVRWAAYIVVPGAAGYAAYRHVVRPWLDSRAARSNESPGVPGQPGVMPEEEPNASPVASRKKES